MSGAKAIMPNKVLGILGGMGPAASARFLQYLIEEFNVAGVYDDVDFPKMIILSLPLEAWDHTGAKDKELVRKQVRAGVSWLKGAGTDIIAAPCNSISEFVSGDDSVISIVYAALAHCKPGPVGVLCSAQTRNSGLYENRGREIQYYPVQDTIDHIIHGVIRGSRPDIGMLINAAFSNCPSVVLGCTELSLCSISMLSSKHVVDSSLALAKAAVKCFV